MTFDFPLGILTGVLGIPVVIVLVWVLRALLVPSSRTTECVVCRFETTSRYLIPRRLQWLRHQLREARAPAHRAALREWKLGAR